MFETIEAFMQKGQWDDALFACEARLQLQPTLGRLHGYKGLCFMRKGQVAEAEPCFKRAYTLDPELWEAAVKHAQCLERLHRYREAMDVVKEWIVRRPNDNTLRGLQEFLKTQRESEEHDGWERSVSIETQFIPHHSD